MKDRRVVIAAVVAFAVSFVTMAMAQEHSAKDEAKTMVDAAVDHVKKVGPEQAFKDFTTDKEHWTKKDLYVVAYDMKGTCVAQGENAKLIGRNLIDLKDPNGVPVIAELTKTAQTKGQGWLDYEWPHPQTKKLATKTTYVRKLANYDGWVAVGFFH